MTTQEEINQLYAEKGELVTQLELGQNKLSVVNQRLAQLLGINQQQPSGPTMVR